MGIFKNKFRIKRVLCYAVFLLAFIFVGFTANSNKVEALEVWVNDGIKYSKDANGNDTSTVSFSVKWDVATATSVSYKFNDGSEIYLNVGSYSSNYRDGTSTVAVYTVDIPNSLTALQKDVKYSSDKNRNFTLYAYASIEKFPVYSYKDNSKQFTYVIAPPTVNKITVSSAKGLLKIGDNIKFSVEFNVPVFSANDIKVGFKIGDKAETTNSCVANSSASKNVIECTYSVAEGYSGEISEVKLQNATKIKGVYSNYIKNSTVVPEKTVYSVNGVSSGVKINVDGIVPYIDAIEADVGRYSEGKSISFRIIFSENLIASGKEGVPEVRIKFGDQTDTHTCIISEEIGVEKTLIYNCVVKEGNQGSMTLVSISGGNGVSDEAGNTIRLTAKDGSSFENVLYVDTIADNGVPGRDGDPVITFDGCDGNYCNEGDSLTVTMKFNMEVKLNDSVSNYFSLMFGNKKIEYEAEEEWKTTFASEISFDYIITEDDEGEFKLGYYLSIVGINQKEVVMSRLEENVILTGYYVDNKAPILGDVEVFVGEEKFETYNVYTAKDKEVKFKFKVEDATEISFDSSKVSLLAEDNSLVSVCDTCDVKKIDSAFDKKTNELIVTVVVGKDNISKNIKIKIGKEALKDGFNKSLEADIEKGCYTLDTYSPSFETIVSYPQYKGYNKSGEWFLISGNEVEFSVSSDDVDLKDYCVVSGREEECAEYKVFEKGVKYSQEISNSAEGDNVFYIKVRDKAGNETVKEAKFVFKTIFRYSNGIGSVAKEHSIDVNVEMFENDTEFKYAWFKKGANINFASANVTRKQDDAITIEGLSTYHGEYMVCINATDDVTLCSDYVEFDTKIDKFQVDVSSSWTNESLMASIVFNDANTIKCIAVGKNYSNLSCDGNNENVVVYKTSQAISPLNKYVIEENGVYHFYIEDAVGNTQSTSKTVTNIDRENVVIEIFNGTYGDDYNTNLEVTTYKKEHRFLVTFDRNGNQKHSLYKYFFAASSYVISNRDDFDNYYLKSSYKREVVSSSLNYLNINSPEESAVYNLYIMAIDLAGNISFASLSDIMVDVEGPGIMAYDKLGKQTNVVGSSYYIVAFDYDFVIEDYASGLDLNILYYNWINSKGSKVFTSDKKYDLCSFDYNVCRVKGENIEFGKNLFDPTDSYKFVLLAQDNSGNQSKFTSSTFKVDTTSPSVSSSIDESKWYNTSDFEIVASKEKNVGTLDGIAYCVNDCEEEGVYNLTKFIKLSVNNPTREEKIISLSLNEGVNVLYVYARDVFGNYIYKEYSIKYDKVVANVVVNNSNEGKIDLSQVENKVIDFTISDSSSGISKYCIYTVESEKECHNLENVKSRNIKYEVEFNGKYYIEVEDAANNGFVYSIDVVGIDIEPISFDLISNVEDGKFTNGSVVISIENMHKSTINDINDYISSIDYVAVTYGSVVSNYSEAFNGSLNNVYTLGQGALVTEFSVNANMSYIVRVIDIMGNVSYKRIDINNIDKEAPLIDVNTYGNGSDRIYLYGANGNVTKDIATGEYNYSNDTVIIRFGEDSLKDKYTGYNNYLAVKVCFKYEDSECLYETYALKTKLNSNKDYLINNGIEITAPYDFDGEIYYYLIDGAGNESSTKSIKINYMSIVNEPVISYAVKNNSGKYGSYKIIYSEAFVSGSVKLKVDDIDLSYFEIYSGVTLESRCYISGSESDINCVKNGEGEIGFVLENGKVYYYLNSGDYTVKAYDLSSNFKEINIYSDSGNPEIKVYKKVEEDYNLQPVGETLFNSLDNLYIKVNDDTFSYMNIDLYNSKTNDKSVSVARYSYVNDLGKCVNDSAVCEYGAALTELLLTSTKGYNQVIITVYDKASNSSKVVINFDNETPEISIKNVGEKIYVNGILYSINEDNLIDVQIGANNRLTLDNLLNEVIIEVDDYSYSEIKNNSKFSVDVYKNLNLFTCDLFESIGSYKVEIGYIDEAGNVAEAKVINIRVSDNVKPTSIILDSDDKVEIKEIIELKGVKIIDNYGLEVDGNGDLIKEKVYGLNEAVCSLVANGGSLSCSGNVEIISLNTYKFSLAGTYTFTYTISDISGNSIIVSQTLYVNDNNGPVMSSEDDTSKVIQIGDRNEDGSINVSEVIVSYPSSYDEGDEANRTVEFVGLFSVNGMGEKYKIINDVYKISDNSLALTYKFTKVGTYYLRFASSDKSNNQSIFEYEIVVEDKKNPVISGSEELDGVIELELGEIFNVEDIIRNYSIVAKDNYDENVALYYEVKSGTEHTYEVVLKATDSSNNSSVLNVFVDMIDTEKPLVGELVIVDSTNLSELGFRVTGGEDNSNNFYHEYSVQNGNWTRYDENSKIVLGADLTTNIQVCIRAVDFAGNISEAKACKEVFVDNKKPVISGVSDGDIYSKEVTINVTDERLESVEFTLNDELMEVSEGDLPIKLSEVGKYSIIARDDMGNVTIVNFIINIDVYMDVVNDFNADDYTITSIDFDKRLLVKADVDYDNNGDSSVEVKLNNISFKEKDVIYILGVVPETTSTFVMFSVNSSDINDYDEGITLVSYGNSFKEGIENEDCLLKINEDYYVYLIVKEDANSDIIIDSGKDEEEKENNGMTIVLAVLGSLATILVGYSVIKFRKRVRAA